MISCLIFRYQQALYKAETRLPVEFLEGIFKRKYGFRARGAREVGIQYPQSCFWSIIVHTMDDFLDIEDVGGLVQECRKDVEEKMKRVLNLLFIFPRHPSYIPLLSPLHPLCPKKSSMYGRSSPHGRLKRLGI